jgi:hypothetical protein
MFWVAGSGISLVLYSLSGFFGLGNGMVEAALLPRLLAALRGRMRRKSIDLCWESHTGFWHFTNCQVDQAVMYAGFHLTSTFADSIFTAISNTIFLWSAAEFMRHSLNGILDEDVLEKVSHLW